MYRIYLIPGTLHVVIFTGTYIAPYLCPGSNRKTWPMWQMTGTLHIHTFPGALNILHFPTPVGHSACKLSYLHRLYLPMIPGALEILFNFGIEWVPYMCPGTYTNALQVCPAWQRPPKVLIVSTISLSNLVQCGRSLLMWERRTSMKTMRYHRALKIIWNI